MDLTAASNILHMIPLNPLSKELPTCFWSLMTITSTTSSVVVHLALACHSCCLGCNNIRRDKEGARVALGFMGGILPSEGEEQLEAMCVTIHAMYDRA